MFVCIDSFTVLRPEYSRKHKRLIRVFLDIKRKRYQPKIPFEFVNIVTNEVVNFGKYVSETFGNIPKVVFVIQLKIEFEFEYHFLLRIYAHESASRKEKIQYLLYQYKERIIHLDNHIREWNKYTSESAKKFYHLYYDLFEYFPQRKFESLYGTFGTEIDFFRLVLCVSFLCFSNELYKFKLVAD